MIQFFSGILIVVATLSACTTEPVGRCPTDFSIQSLIFLAIVIGTGIGAVRTDSIGARLFLLAACIGNALVWFLINSTAFGYWARFVVTIFTAIR